MGSDDAGVEVGYFIGHEIGRSVGFFEGVKVARWSSWLMVSSDNDVPGAERDHGNGQKGEQSCRCGLYNELTITRGKGAVAAWVLGWRDFCVLCRYFI